MCDPTGITEGLAVAGTVAAVAGAATSAYGQYQQTQAADNAAAYNAKVAGYQEAQATQLGQVQAEQNDIATKQLEGRQAAAYAASGVDVNSGTPLTVSEQTAGYGAMDSLAIKQQAATQGWGYGNAMNLDTMKYVNPLAGASTSLLTSGSQIGSSISRLYQSGVGQRAETYGPDYYA